MNFTVEDYKKHGIDELKKRLTEIKQNSPDDFISEQPPKKINGSTSGGIPKGDITKADFTKMTSEQKIEFKESNPEKFREFLNSK